MNAGRIVFPGDSCVSMIFAPPALQDAGKNRIDYATNARCVAVARALDRLARRGIRDVVPTFNAVTVHYDAMQIGRSEIVSDLQELAAADLHTAQTDITTIEIPTTYGGEDGLDLPDIAAFAQCSADEVVRLHASRVYTVYMLGFLPGFAYMGTVDDRIAMPRLDTPRPRVAAGSVGIAAAQTGIYPFDTPGGWRILGKTTAKLFDPARATPALLKAGDRVRFVPA